MHDFSIATMSFSLYLNSLVFLLNMKNLKSSTFPDHIKSSILFHLILVAFKALYFVPKILGSISDLFSIKSYCFGNTSNSISIKLCLLLNIWKYSAIPHVDYFLIKNISYIECIFSPSCSMDSLYGISIRHHLYTFSKSSEKCNTKLLCEFEVLFVSYLLWELRP